MESGSLCGREMFRQISSRIRLPRNSRDLLHAANLRHGTDGFTSPPKEGVLRIFSPLKIRRLRPGLNPRTWAPKASTLPLDHRSRILKIYLLINLNYCEHNHYVNNIPTASPMVHLGFIFEGTGMILLKIGWWTLYFTAFTNQSHPHNSSSIRNTVTIKCDLVQKPSVH